MELFLFVFSSNKSTALFMYLKLTINGRQLNACKPINALLNKKWAFFFLLCQDLGIATSEHVQNTLNDTD